MVTQPLHALGGVSVEEISPGEFQLVVKVSGLTIPDTVTVSNEVEVKNDQGNPIPTLDVSYAAHVAAQQVISVPVAGTTIGLDIAALLAAAHTADPVSAPLTAVPAWATGARLTVWGATGGITYRTDGINPTATTGNPLAAGSAGFPIAGAASVAGLRLISQTSAAVTVTIEFLG